jgi:hypothetical protein
MPSPFSLLCKSCWWAIVAKFHEMNVVNMWGNGMWCMWMYINVWVCVCVWACVCVLCFSHLVAKYERYICEQVSCLHHTGEDKRTQSRMMTVQVTEDPRKLLP